MAMQLALSLADSSQYDERQNACSQQFSKRLFYIKNKH